MLAAALEASPDGVAIVSEDGRIVYANSQFRAAFGYEFSDVVGESVEDLVPDGVRDAHSGHRRHYQEDPHRREMGGGRRLHGRRRDGSEFVAQIALSPVKVGGQTFTVTAVRDVSEHVAAQDVQHRRALADDRERIGLGLHDGVIQRLFAVGLALQGAADQPRDRMADRLREAVEEIDAAIVDLRKTIFALARGSQPRRFRQEVVDIVAQAEAALGHQPTLTISGPSDPRAVADVADDLLAVVGEALTNIAHHANATASSVYLELEADPAQLTLRIEDNGVGLPADVASGDGLSSIARRAHRHAGTVTINSPARGGTSLKWQVPLNVTAPDD